MMGKLGKAVIDCIRSTGLQSKPRMSRDEKVRIVENERES
jgi:hypothetical protein